MNMRKDKEVGSKNKSIDTSGLKIVSMIVEYREERHHRGKPHVEIDGVVINKHTGAYEGFLRRMRKVKLIDSEKVALTISAQDGEGQPAITENPVWTSSNPEIIDIVEDNGQAYAVTTGRIGTARVDLTVDALIGEGEENLTGFIDFEVIAGKAVAVTITPGTPEPR
jgi:hypothetical protein